MKYDIIYPTSLEQIDPDNDNIDILVQTEHGKQYTFVVATPDNLKYLMNKDKVISVFFLIAFDDHSTALR